MFVQVKALQQTVGRARRGGPEVKPQPLARAHAVRLAGRIYHVENNSAVKIEKKEKPEIFKRDSDFTEAWMVGLVVTAEDKARVGMQLT